MSRKIRVMVIGAAGETGLMAVRALSECGAEIVAGIGNRRHLGEDIGELAGIGNIGVDLISARELQRVIEETRPDVALDCTKNFLSEIFDNVKVCMENGVSVISVGVFCHDPWNADPERSRILDEIGKKCNSSFVGASSGDTWQNLPAVLSAGSQKIEKIRLSFHALLDEFGEELARGMGVGEVLDNWEESRVANEDSPWEPIVRLLAKQLGFHASEYSFTQKPIPAKEDIDHKLLNMFIRKGTYLGREEIVTLKTEEGVVIESICYCKVADPGEMNSYEIEITGEPSYRLEISDFHGEYQTSVAMVNRIPDVVKGLSGVITVSDLPAPTFKSQSAFLTE